MPTAPYRFVDRRGTNYLATGNTLHEAASTHRERESYPDLSRDTHRNLSDVGRRTLMTIGRKLFADCPPLEATILEKANLAVGTFLPQYYGRNKTWGRLAESWLVNEWLPMCDLRGHPFDGDTYLDLHVISELRDGDMGTLLTQHPNGYPAIQIIPSHRIRSPLGTKFVKVRLYQDKLWVDGIEIDAQRPFLYEDPIEWEAVICDGVILGPFGNPLAYRVCDDGWGYGNYVDLPARSMFLNYQPKWADQARGFPSIGSGAWDWQDRKESRRFELVAQKVAAALYLIEHNETGERPTAAKLIQEAVYETGDDGTKTLVTPEIQDVRGGIKYFRAGSNSKIDSPGFNRPSQQTQQYQENVMRDALSGMEWSYIFGVDPSKAGGAALRIVVERVNRILDKARKSPSKSFRRIISYAVSKAMKLSLLPWDDDWWMWDFQGPKKLTADAKYDSDVALQEIKLGLTTRKKEIAGRGADYDDVRPQKFAEADELLTDAVALSKKHGIAIEKVMILLSDTTTYATLTNAAQPTGSDAQPEDNNEDETE